MKLIPRGLVVVLAVSLAAACNVAARSVDLPVGTTVVVHLDRALSTASARSGDSFVATLAEPVVLDTKTVLPAGTRFTGHVTEADSSGRLQGRAVLGVTLDAFDLDGQHYAVTTSTETRVSAAHEKRNIEIIGGSSGVGAAVGAIAGGGKGAAIGGLVGAAAGTGAAAATGEENVGIDADAELRFTLKDAVTIER